jgi:hypothetical protein
MLETVPQGSVPIHPARLAVEATRVLPKDAVIVRDGGATSMFFHDIPAASAARFHLEPELRQHRPGPAVRRRRAASRGRHQARDPAHRRLVVSVSRLGTRNGGGARSVPIVCIVGVDYAWGIEAASYKAGFGPQSPETEAHWGTQVRLDKTAESFGAHGEYVERPEDIAPAVETCAGRAQARRRARRNRFASSITTWRGYPAWRSSGRGMAKKATRWSAPEAAIDRHQHDTPSTRWPTLTCCSSSPAPLARKAVQPRVRYWQPGIAYAS